MNLRGLLRFETLIAIVLAAVPLVLRSLDDRGSISAYHDVDDPRWFFIPLTAAAMMLAMNGFVHARRHIHYAVLGVLLIGAVLFDHDGASRTVHVIAAVGFYVIGLTAAALMIAHYLNAATLGGFFTVAAAVVAALAIAWFVFDPPTFWLEAVGLWIIAGYYLWHGRAEAQTPPDDTEPLQVLRNILPTPLVGILNTFLAPFEALWRWWNRASTGTP